MEALYLVCGARRSQLKRVSLGSPITSTAPMNQPLEYSFRWTPQDHVQAMRATIRNMRGSFWRFLPQVSLTVVGIAVLLLFAVVPSDRRLVSFINWLPYVFVLALLNIGLHWWAPWLAARQLQKDDPSVKGGEFRHITSEKGFSVRTVAASIDLTWDHMVQVVETPQFFLYYFKRNGAYATPKHAIPNSDLASLRSTLRSLLGSRARLIEEPNGAA